MLYYLFSFCISVIAGVVANHIYKKLTEKKKGNKED